MRNAARIVGVAALGMTIIPPLLFMFHAIGEVPMKQWMVVGCLLWFASAPFALRGGVQ